MMYSLRPALPTVQFSEGQPSFRNLCPVLEKFRKLDTFLKNFYEFDGV